MDDVTTWAKTAWTETFITRYINIAYTWGKYFVHYHDVHFPFSETNGLIRLLRRRDSW